MQFLRTSPIEALIFFLVLVVVSIGESREPWPPAGRKIICPVTRDVFISSVPGERDGNNGGSRLLKVKGAQEYTLVDIDPSPLKGKLISGALLHLRSQKKEPLVRLGVSSVAAEWVEGSSRSYFPQKGSACFSQAELGRRDWAYPGSTLMDVVFGRGNTLWRFTDLTEQDGGRWQSCAVEADIVAARAAGLSTGFCLYDEVGVHWSLDKDVFTYFCFPNRFFSSRESWTGKPWMEVFVNGEDLIPPEAVSAVTVETEGMPAGEAVVSWRTPRDCGGGKTLGFHVKYQISNREADLPCYLIPMAGDVGEMVRMHIRGGPFTGKACLRLMICPVDSAGNIGPSAVFPVTLSSGTGRIDIPGAMVEPFPLSNVLPTVGHLKVAIIDLLDKINPVNGAMIPRRNIGYRAGNHIFSAKEKKIRLQTAKNETVGFQINLEGKAEDISVQMVFDKKSGIGTEVSLFKYVKVVNDRGKTVSILPDPLIPLRGTVSMPEDSNVPDMKNISLLCEIYTPKEAPFGNRTGKLIISTAHDSLELGIDLCIWNFTLPDKLSFIPEMNAYNTVSPYGGYQPYRLAHKHRTCLNRLPYGWNGLPEFAPEWKQSGFEWRRWDNYVAPLLNGSAFAGLPREGEAVDVFYLPFSENWPVCISKYYIPSYWADEALPDQYRDELGAAFSEFAVHCNEKGWHDTIFQFYLNNKVSYRKKFKGSTAPWLFDEPVNTQDFWALRWYGILWNSSVENYKGRSKMWFRGDISYSQFARNILLGVTDVEYLGGNNYQKTRMKQDEFRSGRGSYFCEYGTANRIDSSNSRPVMWCLSAWAKGALGVLPWQSIGSRRCWDTAEQTALFYPRNNCVYPSVRLKSFTLGQQYVEYLALLGDILDLPPGTVAKWVMGRMEPKIMQYKWYKDDGVTQRLTGMDNMDLWRLRYRIGSFLSQKAPPYKRCLVTRERPPWNRAALPVIGHVSASPGVESIKPVVSQ